MTATHPCPPGVSQTPKASSPPLANAKAVEEWRALAPALAARGRMRLSYDNRRNYPRRLTRALTRDPPPVPAAVHIYDDHGFTQVLAADFDVKRASRLGASDAHGQVAADSAALAALIDSCGGRGFADISPSGGRHAYVTWATPLAHATMRRIALALARRYPSLDPSPMLGRTDGLIRPPGSRHGPGGYQVLTTPLDDARRCVREPNGAEVWERLCEAIENDLRAVDTTTSAQPVEKPPAGTRWRLDGDKMPWLQLPNGKVPHLRADLELIAVTGAYDTFRHDTGSGARYAVLCSAAARGWQLADVTAKLRSGAWEGLAGFYGRYKPRWRTRELAADWQKAVSEVSKPKSDSHGHTREKPHTGGGGGLTVSNRDLGLAGSDGQYQGIRRWHSAFRAVEQVRWPGSHGITVRLVLRAMAAAAQLKGSTVVEFGVRSLGLLAGLDHSTVARVLRELREEDDPFIELLESHRGVRGDLYMLRIPGHLEEASRWSRWRPGRLGVHPVFRRLGAAVALVYEQLVCEPVRGIDLPFLTGVSRAAVSRALRDLAGHGLAERTRGGWRKGEADLDEVADRLGVPELVAALVARYKAERKKWREFHWLMTDLRFGPIPADDQADDVPWPGESLPELSSGSGSVSARGPPGDLGTAVAVLEQYLGPVHEVAPV